MAYDIGRALKHAHTAVLPRVILHRDVKLANILLTNDGSFKLTDFGVAKLVEGAPTMTNVAGTWGRLDPVVAIDGESLAPTDIYGLGSLSTRCSLGDCLTRDATRTVGELTRIGSIPPLEEMGRRVSPALEAIVRRMTARNGQTGTAASTRSSTTSRAARAGANQIQRFLASQPPDESPAAAPPAARRRPVTSTVASSPRCMRPPPRWPSPSP